MSGEYKKNLGIKIPLLRKYTGWNQINNDNAMSAFLDGKNIANGKTKKELYGKLSSEQSLNQNLIIANYPSEIHTKFKELEALI